MMYSRIIGTGSYLPEKILTNYDLESMIDTDHDWIMARTGISERRIAADDEFTCDLAEKAARKAIDSAGISISEIDLLVVATTTADQIFPSTACLLQARLGISGPPAFDVQAVCAGFMFALDVADKFIRTGSAKCALVVGAETFSRIIDWTDRSTCILFGDGGGAVVLKADQQPGVLSTHLHADGKYNDLLCVPAGVSKRIEEFDSRGIETAERTVETLAGAYKGMWKNPSSWEKLANGLRLAGLPDSQSGDAQSGDEIPVC